MTATDELRRLLDERGVEQPVDNAQADSRERLEADVREWCATFPAWNHASEFRKKMFELLDRQAAITERECREQPCNNISCSIALGNQNLIAENRELHKRVDNLTADRDELQSIIDHMPKTEAECEACQDAHDRLMFNAKMHQDELNEHWRKANDGWAEANAEAERWRQKCDELRDKLHEKQHVCDVQRDSFAKMEREYRELQDVCGELERTVENLRGD